MAERNWLRAGSSALALLAMLQPFMAVAASGAQVEAAPRSSAEVQKFASNPAREPFLSATEKLALLRQKVKYVFVLFQENRSFDFYFGTYPGANGLFSKKPGATAGFVQPLVGTDGKIGTIQPFLIPETVKDVNGKTVPIYSADTDSVDHSHKGIDNSLNVDRYGIAANNRYALNEEGLTTKNGKIVSLATGLPPTANPTLVQKQRGELVMGHVDCTAAPFLWQYADRFALFDNFRQTIIGPSTPNAIAMIAGQSGETQWALHPAQASSNSASSAVATSGGEPIVGDPGPFAGSNLDFSKVKPPYNPGDENPATPAFNQTYASLPLSFMGGKIDETIQSDENPALDLLDVQDDIKAIWGRHLSPVSWGWYQEGYDHERTDTGAAASHASYIIHHNGPQYFGYVGDNPKVASNLHGLGDFFSDVTDKKLPSKGGVFYVRGGYANNDGLKPVDQNPAVQANFIGDDDHPGYSDLQISEALLANEINAIAASPYWKDSAIIITYDETDGLYDHEAPVIRSHDPEGAPLGAGPRIPAIVISPYGQAHVISHEYSEHGSVIKFIDRLFDLTPLAFLPDEAKARALGKQEFGQDNLGPSDGYPSQGDLSSAFDNARLTGAAAPLPADYAMIADSRVKHLPHDDGQGCYALNIVPTDYAGGKLLDPAPADFNPRPGTTPGIPTAGTWTP
ncbi:MAG TPA: alkaline phosphatase family protein [Aliidongia sp.]|nr:alkaline phosphatase family protein [Aliidongia sp.]